MEIEALRHRMIRSHSISDISELPVQENTEENLVASNNHHSNPLVELKLENRAIFKRKN